MPPFKRVYKQAAKTYQFKKEEAIYLIIVESPSKCAKIETYLGPNYKCIATRGHFREIDGLKHIDTQQNYGITFSIVQDKKGHVEYMRDSISQFPHENVYLATDDDREGEAIAWHICETFGLPERTTPRILFREITKPAILDALKSPTLLNMRLVKAQHARQVLDMIVGFKISPILWKKLFFSKENSLSAGRCQTPALRLVYDNENERKASSLEMRYKTVGYFFSKNIPFDLGHEFEKEEEMEEFLEKSKTHSHKCTIEETKDTKRSPPIPFSTSRILQAASNALHYSPKTTMQICQNLYQDGHITYMRTENTKYSGVFLEQLDKFVTKEYGEKYVGNLGQLENKDKTNPHEAIRVTNLNLRELDQQLDKDKKNGALYKLIWKNTVESCMAEAQFKSTKIKIHAPNSSSKASLYYSTILEIPLFLGWKKVAPENYTKDADLLLFFQALSEKTRESVPCEKIESLVVVRNSCSHYTESTLIKKLEDLGIGRPSTFALLVDTIQERGYVKCMDVEGKKQKCTDFRLIFCKKSDAILDKLLVEKTFGQEKKKLVIQSTGILCIEFLIAHFNTLFEYNYTRMMEEGLDEIAANKDTPWYNICGLCDKEIESLATKALSDKKPVYPIDSEHELVFQQFGPVIRRLGIQPSYISVKKGMKIDIEKAKAGGYLLKDLMAIPKENLGQYNGKDVLLKTGKYGPYIQYGDKTYSLKDCAIPLEEIFIEDVLGFLNSREEEEPETLPESSNNTRPPPIPKNKNVLRPLNSDMSVRSGKFGPYVYYKTEKMKAPQFFNLKKFKQNPCTCDDVALITWINKEHSL